MFMMLLVYEFQSLIKAIVCANFITRALSIADRERDVKRCVFLANSRFYIVYWTIVTGVQLTVFILAFLPATEVHCDGNLFTSHFFAILGLDLFQSVLIAVAGSFLKQSISQRHMSNIKDSIAIEEMKNRDECLFQQVKIMTIFYMLFTLIDLVLIISGNSFYQKENFTCLFHDYLIVTSDWGALYMFIHSSFFFLFAVMMWFIFYRLPRLYGLVVSRTNAPRVTLKSFANEGQERLMNDESMRIKEMFDLDMKSTNNRQNSLNKNASEVALSPRRFGTNTQRLK